jgi:hypothetical protein
LDKTKSLGMREEGGGRNVGNIYEGIEGKYGKTRRSL